jgi:hypothetical protein
LTFLVFSAFETGLDHEEDRLQIVASLKKEG